MTRIPNTRTTQKKNNAGGRTQHNKSQRRVKTLNNLLDNENKNLYPMNKMDYINIDIALCKDKGVMNYKIFNIEKKQFTDGQDHTDSKFIDATAENLNAEISKIKSSGKLQHVNDTTQYIHIMLVLRDNDNNKPGSLKIYKVTNLPHNESSNKDKCVIGAIIHTEDVDTQNINSDNAIIVEPVVNSGEVPTIDRNRRKHRGQRHKTLGTNPITPDKTVDAKLDIDDAKLTFVLNALNNILDKDNTDVDLEDTVVELYETFTEEFGEDTKNQDNLQNIFECIKHNWPDDRVDQIERLEEERDCIKIIQIMRKIDNFNISSSENDLIPIHKILAEITTIIGDQYTKIKTLLKVGITNPQLLQVNKELQDHLNTKNVCANEPTYEESEPVKNGDPYKPVNVDTNDEKNVETLAIIGLIQQFITKILGKLNEVHTKERNKSSTELTDIKSLDQQLLNTINNNKDKLIRSDWYMNATLKRPTYTIDNIQKVLKNYQDRLNHVGFLETIKLKETNFKDKVSDGLFIFTNLDNYFSGNLDAILHDLGNGLKEDKNKTTYNYITNKHEGGRVTHKNKRKLKKQKRRYTKRANRK